MAWTKSNSTNTAASTPLHAKAPLSASTWQSAPPEWQWRRAASVSGEASDEECENGIGLEFCLRSPPDYVEHCGKKMIWPPDALEKLERDWRHGRSWREDVAIDPRLYERKLTDALGSWYCHAIRASRLRVIAPPHKFTIDTGVYREDGEHVTVACLPRDGKGTSGCHIYFQRCSSPVQIVVSHVTRMNEGRKEYLCPVGRH